MYKKYLINLLYYILGIILLGVIYEIIVLIKNDINFTPQFDDIFKSFFNLLGDINTYKGVLNTIKNVLISVFISSISK
jgi:ABC-type nitrate/sulfonate/bicarbonate transport system permease component